MAIEKNFINPFSLLLTFLLLSGCNPSNNFNQQKVMDSIIPDNPITQIDADLSFDSTLIPNDTISFSTFLYLHAINKNPNKSLVKKYLIPDIENIDNESENGIFFYVDLEEIYKTNTLVIIVFSLCKEEAGSQTKDTYIATFTQKGEKINQHSFNSLTTTEWNNIMVSFEYKKDNILQRKSIDQSYSPENGGRKIVKSDTLIERFQIEPDGKIH